MTSKPSALLSLLTLVALVALLLASSVTPAAGDGVTPTALPPGELWTATPGATETPLARPTWIVSPAPLRTPTATAAVRVYLPYVEKGR